MGQHIVDAVLVALYVVGLQYFLCAEEGVRIVPLLSTVAQTVIRLDVLPTFPTEYQLHDVYLGYVSDTRLMLDIEARTYVVNKLIVVLEVLRMVLAHGHQIGTVVVILGAVLGSIGLVEVNLEVIVLQRIGGRCLVAVCGVDISLGYRVEVRVVILPFLHRLAHLVCRHLHRCEGIAVRTLVVYEQIA